MLVDDHLAVGLLALFLDHGRALLAGFFLLDHGRTVTIMRRANGHAGAYRADTHANPRIVRVRGRDRQRKASHGRQSNCKFHFSSSSVCPLHQFHLRNPVPATKFGQRLEPFVEWTLPSPAPPPVARRMNPMPRKLRTAAVAALLCWASLSCWASPALAESINVGGVARTFIAQLPAGKGAPLVIVLHGNAQTGEDVATRTSWPQIAKREKFAVVFP